jgi:hypothetical protein
MFIKEFLSSLELFDSLILPPFFSCLFGSLGLSFSTDLLSFILLSTFPLLLMDSFRCSLTEDIFEFFSSILSGLSKIL